MKQQYAIATLLLISILLASPHSSWAQGDSTSSLSSIASEAFEVMRHFFEYDPEIPLEARTVDRLEEQSYLREKIVFRGIRNSRVPGYFERPAKWVTL